MSSLIENLNIVGLLLAHCLVCSTPVNPVTAASFSSGDSVDPDDAKFAKTAEVSHENLYPDSIGNGIFQETSADTGSPPRTLEPQRSC